MSSDKMLQIIVKKKSSSGDLCKFDNIISLFTKYRKVVVSMQGFERREILEAIRPLTTANISTTLIVYNGRYEGSEDYDEKLVIGQDG